MLVEGTPGFVKAYASLERVYKHHRTPDTEDVERLEAFTVELELRLPYRTVPRREEECPADIPIVKVPNPRTLR